MGCTDRWCSTRAPRPGDYCSYSSAAPVRCSRQEGVSPPARHLATSSCAVPSPPQSLSHGADSHRPACYFKPNLCVFDSSVFVAIVFFLAGILDIGQPLHAAVQAPEGCFAGAHCLARCQALYRQPASLPLQILRHCFPLVDGRKLTFLVDHDLFVGEPADRARSGAHCRAAGLRSGHGTGGQQRRYYRHAKRHPSPHVFSFVRARTAAPPNAVQRCARLIYGTTGTSSERRNESAVSPTGSIVIAPPATSAPPDPEVPKLSQSNASPWFARNNAVPFFDSAFVVVKGNSTGGSGKAQLTVAQVTFGTNWSWPLTSRLASPGPDGSPSPAVASQAGP